MITFFSWSCSDFIIIFFNNVARRHVRATLIDECGSAHYGRNNHIRLPAALESSSPSSGSLKIVGVTVTAWLSHLQMFYHCLSWKFSQTRDAPAFTACQLHTGIDKTGTSTLFVMVVCGITCRHICCLLFLVDPLQICAMHYGIVFHMMQRFWWPELMKDILDCSSYSYSEASHQPPVGLLQPLTVPPQPWFHVTLDFITGLSLQEATSSFSMLWTVSPGLPTSLLCPSFRLHFKPLTFS